MLARAVRALMAERREWEGTASELLDLLGGVSQIPNPKVLSDELSRFRADAAHRRGRRALPPEQCPARDHDRSAVTCVTAQVQSPASRASPPDQCPARDHDRSAVTCVTHRSKVLRHVRHRRTNVRRGITIVRQVTCVTHRSKVLRHVRHRRECPARITIVRQ